MHNLKIPLDKQTPNKTLGHLFVASNKAPISIKIITGASFINKSSINKHKTKQLGFLPTATVAAPAMWASVAIPTADERIKSLIKKTTG
jgi:hypothetical protein